MSGNLSIKDTVQELFGKTRIRSPFSDMPSALSSLHLRLHEDTLITPDKLINEHTFFPIYKPFLSEDRANRAIQLMKECSHPGAIFSTIGLQGYAERESTKYLNYCSECYREEQENFGEAYWHRSHQASRVKICHKHKTWLNHTGLPTPKSYISNPQFILPQSGLSTIRSNLSLNKYYEQYVRIAEGMHWLLNNNLPVIGLNQLSTRYVFLLKKRNLTYYSGCVKGKQLSEEFNNYYGKDFLRSEGLEVDYSNRSNWLFKMFQMRKQAWPPIKHLLVMQFLGLKNADLWNVEMTMESPFGAGPWLCLNPISSHVRKLVITDCKIKKNGHTGTPIGHFICPLCGFSYGRTGPDKGADDSFRYTSIISRGFEWENKFNELKEMDISFREMARRLNCDIGVILRRLGRGAEEQKCLKKDGIKLMNEFEKKRSQIRNAFIRVRRKHPDKSRLELHDMVHKTYTWLNYHDKEWLRENLPPLKRRKKIKACLDWDARDTEVSQEIPTIVERLLGSKGKASRISKRELFYQIEKGSSMERNLHRMPKTMHVLQTILGRVNRPRKTS